ncbi:hypothetical protein [Pseudophaeobacter sp. C1-32P7]|uniref:hypothetical protein n=1 Tax=Pseudophaeobacter sp. C1-32P7 TaxID=3098142 RepID=UPI0034D6D464
MVEVDEEREATASIRGYFYQLDAALLGILSAGLDDKVVVEGVEDFDLYSHTETAYHQVKYCEAQKLTASTLRAPLFKLFDHFNKLKEEDRSGRKYILYGHYKEIGLSLSPLNCIDFKRFMSYEKAPKGKPRTAHSLLDDLTYEDSTIEAFCKLFEFRPARKYLDQKNEVIGAIRESQGVSDVEASGFHYPLALEYVGPCCANRVRDSLRESSVIAGRYEQLGPYEV